MIPVKIIAIYNDLGSAELLYSLPAIPPPGSYVMTPDSSLGLKVYSAMYAPDVVTLQIRMESPRPIPSHRERMTAAGWIFRD